MPMMAKWIGFIPTDCASGCRMVPKMMIAGNGVEEAPDHQEHEGDEESRRGDAHPPRGNVLEQRARNLVVGEQPAEGDAVPTQKSATEESLPVSTNES